MSKCSVLSTCQWKFSYWTLLRPKYWAEASPGRHASAASARAKRSAVREGGRGRAMGPPLPNGEAKPDRLQDRQGTEDLPDLSAFKTGALDPAILAPLHLPAVLPSEALTPLAPLSQGERGEQGQERNASTVILQSFSL